MSIKNLRFIGATVAVAGILAISTVSPLQAQTINGVLMEAGVERRIQLGQMVLVGAGGDTVDVAYTNDNGFFSLSTNRPGDYLVLADALGYGAVAAGVFELGEDSEMTIEYRMKPFALPIEDLVVEFDRPIRQHSLVQNGFVARYNRGVGHFLTPYMIEESAALSTAQLFRNIPGVGVGAVGGGSNYYLGDAVRLRTPAGDWCDPLLYIDGMRTENNPEMGMTLGMLVPKNTIQGIEIYRRAAEIPLEYGIGTPMTGTGAGNMANFCGVLVIWTRRR
jgi:hypothetical protein